MPAYINVKEVTYLYSIFGQVGFNGQHFASVHVRIMGLLEGFFQFIQLIASEDRAAVASFLFLFFPTESVNTVYREFFAGIYTVA